MTLLTADDVLKKTFQTTKFRDGYDQDEVDDFLDEVVETLRVLQGENAQLKARVAELDSGGGAEASPRPDAVTEVQVDPAPAPAPIPESAPNPVAAFAGDGSEPESATGMLQLAQRLHDEYVRNGKEEGDRLVSEARVEAERLVAEAEAQRSRTLQQLESEQSTLEHKISQLRTFERDYRMRLKGFLGSLLETLDAQASVVGIDGPPTSL